LTVGRWFLERWRQASWYDPVMTPDSVLDIGQRALEVTTVLGGVVLIPALLVGLFTVALVFMLAGPWMLQVIMTFSVNLIESIPELIG